MLMTRQEILENLKEILMDADERGSELVDKVSEQSRLTEDLGLSSVNMLYMIIATEEVQRVPNRGRRDGLYRG